MAEPDEVTTLGPEPTPEFVEAAFTRSDGSFRFHRWGRPIAPAIIGTNDEGCRVFENAIKTVAKMAAHPVEDLDPELGANLLVFLVNEWEELEDAPNLIKLIPNLTSLIADLDRIGANQYRVFGFDPVHAIRICTVFLRYDEELKQVSAGTLALGQAYQSMLLWSDAAFRSESPLAITPEGLCLIKPSYASLLRVAYDRTLPDTATDPAFSHRLAARMSVAV
ncbi:MAG: hypothetical protein AAF334_08810 [Pseudomonadota bacterium]